MNNYLTTSRDLKKADFLDRLSGNEMKRMKQLILKNGKVSCEFSRDKSRDKCMSVFNAGYVYVALCSSAFMRIFESANETENKSLVTEFLVTNHETNHEHNKEVFNQEYKKTKGVGFKIVRGKQKIRYP